MGAVALGAVAGVAGAGVAAQRAGALPLGPAGKPFKLGIDVRGWRLQVQGKAKGEPLAQGDRAAVFGELLGGGRKIGEFYSTSVFVGAPMGVGPHSAAYVETHHFNLEEGTLLGSGTARPAGPADYAVIGGTGRYAGATGSYSAIQNPIELGGDGSATFNFNLVLQET